MDLVSDEERDNLVFVHLDIDPSIQILEGVRWARWGWGACCGAAMPLEPAIARRGPLPLGTCPNPNPTLPSPNPNPALPQMRPFMMPIFFYGGQISKALESPSLSASQTVALTEIRSLLSWLLMQLGIISQAQAEVLLRFMPLARPSTLDHRAARSSGVAAVIAFLKGLQGLQGKVPDEATRRNRRARGFSCDGAQPAAHHAHSLSRRFSAPQVERGGGAARHADQAGGRAAQGGQRRDCGAPQAARQRRRHQRRPQDARRGRRAADGEPLGVGEEIGLRRWERRGGPGRRQAAACAALGAPACHCSRARTA